MYLWGKNLEKHTRTHHLFIMSSLAAADPYAWKDAGFEGQCAVIMGYGGGVSDKVLQVLTESGMKVAIVSRTQAKLVRAIPLAKSFSAPSLCLTPSPTYPLSVFFGNRTRRPQSTTKRLETAPSKDFRST